MVEDDVLDDPHVPVMAGGHHVPVRRIPAEAGVDLVMVRDGIAMVAGPGLVVEEHGVEPEGVDTEGIEVVHVLGNALEVASVPGIHLGTVDALFAQSFDCVIRGIAIGEPVGHDQVEGGARDHAHSSRGPGRGCVDRVGEAGGLVLGRPEDEFMFTRSAHGCGPQVYKEVVRMAPALHGVHDEPF